MSSLRGPDHKDTLTSWGNLGAALAHQPGRQGEAQVAYRRWWSLTRGMDRLDAMALDPLEDTGLAWYGSVRR